MTKNPDHAAGAVVGIREVYPSLAGRLHAHERAQLVYAVEGVITVTTSRGHFVVPSRRAVFVPALERHKVESKRPFRLTTLYFDVARVDGLPAAPAVVEVSPLLRELVLALVDAPWGGYPAGGRTDRLVSALLAELDVAGAAPLSLPLPTDPRARRVAAALVANPADASTLTRLAHLAKASPRHLERVFVAETGLTLGAYRQQVRLLAALDRLAAGASVLETALDLGYQSASSFGVMFKRALGVSPARYYPRASRR
ncbi:MAG: helix-turn-helix transcriptional regulator [Polyangiaceae bacterium]